MATTTVGKKAGYEPLVDTMIRVKDLKVRVRRQHGEGRPLVLINGMGACLEAWGPLTMLLRGRDIVAIDHPGCGLSSPPNYIMSMLELAEFYTLCMDEMDIDVADVMGFSFGGTITMQLAKDFPERVNSIILTATSPGLGQFPASPLTILFAANPMRYQIPIVREISAPIIYRGRAGRHPRLFESELAGWDAHRATMLGVGAQVGAFMGWSALPWLPMLDKPTLVLGGEEDPMAPVSNSALMASLIPGAELQVFEGGGHLFAFDMADKVAPFVNDFLDRVNRNYRAA